MYEEKKKKVLNKKESNNRFFTFKEEIKNNTLYPELLSNINW